MRDTTIKYDYIKQIKTRAAPTDEQIDELSEQQLQKVSLSVYSIYYFPDSKITKIFTLLSRLERL